LNQAPQRQAETWQNPAAERKDTDIVDVLKDMIERYTADE